MLWINEFSRDSSLRWVSNEYPLLHSTPDHYGLPSEWMYWNGADHDGGLFVSSLIYKLMWFLHPSSYRVFYWDMDCDCLGGTERILKIWDNRSASNHDESLQDVTHGLRYIDYLGGVWVGGGGGGVDGVGWAFQKQLRARKSWSS